MGTKTLRIIQILNSPNWSGASSYCVTLSRKLIEAGDEILLLTEPGRPLEEARAAGIPTDDSIRLNHRNPYLYVHAMKRMKRIFSSFEPDIISSHINEGAWMAGLIARWVCPTAVVVRTRSDIDPPKGHFINRFVHHRWTDHLIVSSRLHKRLCEKILDFPPEAIDVVYGAVDPDRFRPGIDPSRRFRASIAMPRGGVAIGLLARLDPVKGHEYALQALSRLAASPVPWKLCALGYENQRTFSWLREQALQLGIADRIETFGMRNDLPEVLDSLDVGLISSIGSEANCRAALEFMASGKPVVATTVGVIPEIIREGEEGFLVPPENPQAMAAALARLISNPLLRQTMGKTARGTVMSNFNLDLFAARTGSVFRKAIGRKLETLDRKSFSPPHGPAS